jgi:hypothetical protein
VVGGWKKNYKELSYHKNTQNLNNNLLFYYRKRLISKQFGQFVKAFSFFLSTLWRIKALTSALGFIIGWK